MKLATLKEMVMRLEHAGGTVSFVDSLDEQLVDQTAERLNLQFPESVRSFYQAYEYLQVGVHEFVWVKDMQETINRVRARYRDVPVYYLPVLSDDMGGYYYVVCAERGQPQPSDYGTVVYNPAGAAGVYELASPDFLEFVASKVTAEMDEVRGT